MIQHDYLHFLGGLRAAVRHAGDLGNIRAGRNRVARIRIIDRRLRLSRVIRRGIIVHADRDDLGLGGDEGSRTTGNAGARLACCIIA